MEMPDTPVVLDIEMFGVGSSGIHPIILVARDIADTSGTWTNRKPRLVHAI